MIVFETKTPNDFKFRTLLYSVVLGGLVVMEIYGSENVNSDGGDRTTLFWMIVLVLAAHTLVDYYSRHSYLLGYDQEAIFWRRTGLRRSSAPMTKLKFEDVGAVTELTEAFGMKPFDAIAVFAVDSQVPDIIMSRLYVNDQAIVEVLLEISKRKNVFYNDEIRDFISAA